MPALLCPDARCRLKGSALLDDSARKQQGQLPGDPEADAALTSVSASGGEAPWPTPPAPAAYHGLAGRVVETMDAHTEADRTAILVQLLAAFGSAIGRGPHFPVESSRHHPNLNVVLVGQTAKGRKGTSWEHVHRLMREADEGWAVNRTVSGLSSGEGLIWAVRDPIYRKEPIKEKGRITGYQDLLVDEGVSDKRLFVIESEFARVLRVAGREGNTLSTTVREAWDSGRLRTLTKNSPAVATDAHVSIVGHVTKDELLRNLAETETANGFANRFLWVCVRRSKLLPEGGGALDLAFLAHEIRAGLAFARKLGTTPIVRDAEAGTLWRSVYPRLSDGRPGITGAVLGRAEAQVMRLALVYALLDRTDTIRVLHLRAALALWNYIERSVRWVFGDATGDRVADDILGVLRASPQGVTRTELLNHFKRHLSAERLDHALSLIQRIGRAYMASESTGGRHAERWRCERSDESEVSPDPDHLGSLTSLSSQPETRTREP